MNLTEAHVEGLVLGLPGLSDDSDSGSLPCLEDEADILKLPADYKFGLDTDEVVCVADIAPPRAAVTAAVTALQLQSVADSKAMADGKSDDATDAELLDAIPSEASSRMEASVHSEATSKLEASIQSEATSIPSASSEELPSASAFVSAPPAQAYYPTIVSCPYAYAPVVGSVVPLMPGMQQCMMTQPTPVISPLSFPTAQVVLAQAEVASSSTGRSSSSSSKADPAVGRADTARADPAPRAAQDGTARQPSAKGFPQGRRYRGVVKSFVHNAGFGFISCPELADKHGDVFLHRAQFRSIAVGQEVEFSVALNKDGKPQARYTAPMGCVPGCQSPGTCQCLKGRAASKPRTTDPQRAAKARKSRGTP